MNIKFAMLVLAAAMLLLMLKLGIIKPIVVSFDFSFGAISKEGYRHFPILYLAYGSNGFTICVFGATFTIKSK